jgi:membrane protease subunit (stomatin/prohibitin family)
MGLFDAIRGQFIDVIQWEDQTHDTIVWKFHRRDNAIKSGAQLIVRESQKAVFLHEGELGDVFGPGRHRLTTNNIPILTSLSNWKYGFDAPFQCDVFFVSTRQFTDQKWGTRNPIMMRDAEFGPIRLRAFGSYCFQVTDPGTFVKQISGTNSDYDTASIAGQFRNMLAARFSDALGELKIPALDLAANYNEMGDDLREKLQPEFDEYGVTLTKFLVENISLPEEVEKALDTRSSMGVLGNMNTYTQFKTANAIGDMAKNQGGGGNMMGMFAGVNMGQAMGSAMQQGAQAPQQPGAMPPPVPQAVQWYVAANGQQLGPYDGNAMSQHVQGGHVTRETMVWKQGMAAWTPAGQVPELAGLFGAPPPMPPPMPPPGQ